MDETDGKIFPNLPLRGIVEIPWIAEYQDGSMISLPPLNLPETCRKIQAFIQRKLREAGAEGVVLGLSGGIDSSTVAYLCSRSLGGEKVLALILPDRDVTPKQDIEDAISISKSLGLRYEIIEISNLYDNIVAAHPLSPQADIIAKGNLKARLRMILLYYASNISRKLVVGSGDRSELMLGYFTKYGDGAADLLPLGGLYKTQVRELARYLGVPSHIIHKPSSPRLWAGQTAEEELGMSYEIIDLILHAILDLKMEEADIAKELGVSLGEVRRIKQMVERTEHKRMMPPIAEIELMRG